MMLACASWSDIIRSCLLVNASRLVRLAMKPLEKTMASSVPMNEASFASVSTCSLVVPERTLTPWVPVDHCSSASIERFSM